MSESAITPKTMLPGFGRPVNYVPNEKDPDFVGKLLPNVLTGKEFQMMTVRESTMLQIMNVATDKLDWHVKVQDHDIMKKWKMEALNSGRDVTEKMVDWCLDELRYKAKSVTEPPAPIVVYNGDVVKSDNAVSLDLKEALLQSITIFERKIPEKLKDWHPGSDQKVWNLVHPSLFPLVYGCTRVLANGETTALQDCIQRCGQGEVTKVPTVKAGHGLAWTCSEKNNPYSANFQWLPCEVDISGDQAQIVTYINNLHPLDEKPLYDIISRLITASIPLWDLTLAPLWHNGFLHERRINYSGCVYDPDPARGPDTDGPQMRDDEDDRDYVERRYQWCKDTQRVVRPEPETFKPMLAPPPFSLQKRYGARGLQVIVKLANIELTPEKPAYAGGSWHIEGQVNEHIVATSLYYYSCSNITTSSLSFRQQCDPEQARAMLYRQDNHDWLPEVFGCENEEPAVQEIGSVETREGRLLTFPNVLQHRVGPFMLADPSKPGHRKIVALFLVDPNIKVISTAHVPCQRKDWWFDAILDAQEAAVESTSAGLPRRRAGISGLPVELQDHILEQVEGFPISMEDAFALRLQLMEERKVFVTNHSERVFEGDHFSLCEH
ncbi:hypothetical protein B0H34DRAFT_59324 [Crassisporium funariophilum]|nr:hypothetical protein B0H34DRAFT_59324 [Crassisporium funariophilum]